MIGTAGSRCTSRTTFICCFRPTMARRSPVRLPRAFVAHLGERGCVVLSRNPCGVRRRLPRRECMRRCGISRGADSLPTTRCTPCGRSSPRRPGRGASGWPRPFRSRAVRTAGSRRVAGRCRGDGCAAREPDRMGDGVARQLLSTIRRPDARGRCGRRLPRRFLDGLRRPESDGGGRTRPPRAVRRRASARCSSRLPGAARPAAVGAGRAGRASSRPSLRGQIPPIHTARCCDGRRVPAAAPKDAAGPRARLAPRDPGERPARRLLARGDSSSRVSARDELRGR